MKRLLVINPNTSRHMTEGIRQSIETVRRPDIEVAVENAEVGPESLESFYEYSLATLGVLDLLKNRRKDYDGLLLACFGDPGLYALKEYCEVPVVGIAEASMALSLLLGHKFSILVALDKAIPMMESMVMSYGLESRLAGIRALSIPVLGLETDREGTLASLESLGRRALGDGAEVIILGCAGLTPFAPDLAHRLGTTVIDPVVAGYQALEAVVSSRFGISRRGLYQAPPDKKIRGKITCST